MTEKLPVKTYKLRRRKKAGLILFIILELFLTVFFFQLGLSLERNFGKMICAVLFLSSLVVAAFAIFALIYLIKEKFVGFFISGDGLNDISTGNDFGVIMWRDVLKVRVMNDLQSPKNKYIILKVRNPQEYIDRETLSAKKRSMILKLHYYGSPICFSNRGLDCSFEELEQSVKLYHENFLQRKKEREEEFSKIN